MVDYIHQEQNIRIKVNAWMVGTESKEDFRNREIQAFLLRGYENPDIYPLTSYTIEDDGSPCFIVNSLKVGIYRLKILCVSKDGHSILSSETGELFGITNIRNEATNPYKETATVVVDTKLGISSIKDFSNVYDILHGVVHNIEKGTTRSVCKGGGEKDIKLSVNIGKSAYQYAVEHGFSGTEDEFGQMLAEFNLGDPSLRWKEL